MLPDSVFGSCILKPKQVNPSSYKEPKIDNQSLVVSDQKHKNHTRRMVTQKPGNHIKFDDDANIVSDAEPEESFSQSKIDSNTLLGQEMHASCKKRRTLPIEPPSNRPSQLLPVNDTLTNFSRKSSGNTPQLLPFDAQNFEDSASSNTQLVPSSSTDLQNQGQGQEISLNKSRNHTQNMRSPYRNNSDPKDAISIPLDSMLDVCVKLEKTHSFSPVFRNSLNSSSGTRNQEVLSTGQSSKVGSTKMALCSNFELGGDNGTPYHKSMSDRTCTVLPPSNPLEYMFYLDWIKCQSDLASLTETYQRISTFLHETNFQIIEKQKELQNCLSKMISSHSSMFSANQFSSPHQSHEILLHTCDQNDIPITPRHLVSELPKKSQTSGTSPTQSFGMPSQAFGGNSPVSNMADQVSSHIESIFGTYGSDSSFAETPVLKASPKACINHHQLSYFHMMTSGKPRYLVLNETSGDSLLEDTLIACDIHGEFQTFSRKDRRKVSNYPPFITPSAHTGSVVEDLVWNQSGDVLAMAYSPGNSAQLVMVAPIKSTSSNQINFVLAPMQPNTQHLRGISCITQYKGRSVSSAGVSCSSLLGVHEFITGGADKTIHLWSKHADGSFSSTHVHSAHKSRVNAVLHNHMSGSIISGGSDRRLILYDLEQRAIDQCHKLESRISTVQLNEKADLLLLTFLSSSNQLMLWDIRKKKFAHQFGCAESNNLSRYVRPSWHKDGNLVVCGGSDVSASIKDQASIHLWDIRMLRRRQKDVPVHTLSINTSRIVHCLFAPNASSLYALAVDRSMVILDYTLN